MFAIIEAGYNAKVKEIKKYFKNGEIDLETYKRIMTNLDKEYEKLFVIVCKAEKEENN